MAKIRSVQKNSAGHLSPAFFVRKVHLGPFRTLTSDRCSMDQLTGIPETPPRRPDAVF
jgi:hypothetical protein